MSTEELDALAGEAAKIDQQIAPVALEAEPEQSAQPAPTEAASIAALVQIMAGLFAPVFPSLQKIYTDTACRQIGDAAAPVMAKHGWTTGELLGKYAEELALLAVVAPLGFATWQGIQTDIAAATGKANRAKPKTGELTEQQKDAVSMVNSGMTHAEEQENDRRYAEHMGSFTSPQFAARG